jgi:hypothetical protein
MIRLPAASLHSGVAGVLPPPRARIGLQLEQLRTTSAGRVVLTASDSHRIKMHASGPVRGACGAHKFVYLRGQVDVVPPWHRTAGPRTTQACR